MGPGPGRARPPLSFCFCPAILRPKLDILPQNIAHLGSHHLANHNEAAHTPLDPPRRVSVKMFSLSRFCKRRNSFLKKVFGKPAPEGVIRVGTVTLKSVLLSEQLLGHFRMPFWPLCILFWKGREIYPKETQTQEGHKGYPQFGYRLRGSSRDHVEPPRGGGTTGGGGDYTTIPHA